MSGRAGDGGVGHQVGVVQACAPATEPSVGTRAARGAQQPVPLGRQRSVQGAVAERPVLGGQHAPHSGPGRAGGRLQVVLRRHHLVCPFEQTESQNN
jgi:hypothetical protein